MKYAFTCPAPGCGHTMEVEAVSEDEALQKLLAEGGKHQQTTHPDMNLDPEKAVAMVRVGMKKLN